MVTPLVGCCGWCEGRAKYFGHFPVVELQSTFYEPPTLALATKWRAAAPPDFRFCVKAWQLITHRSTSSTYRRLRSKLTEEELLLTGAFQLTEQVWLAWERTAEIARILRAEVILFQCPPSLEPDRQTVRNIHAFFAQADRGESKLAWEPRGAWPDQLVGEICAEHNLLHCVDPFKAISVHGTPHYLRLHGRGGYHYRYSDEELNELRAMLREGAPAYVLFNNIWMKDDALRFQGLLSAREVSGFLHAPSARASFSSDMNNNDHYKQLLLAKKQDLDARVSRSATEARESRLAEVGDEMDLVTSNEGKSEQLQEGSLEYQMLTQVDEALARLEAGEYGKCIECDREIEPARLEAVPWTPYCIEDQEKIEKAQGVPVRPTL